MEVVNTEFSNNSVVGMRLFAKGGGVFLLGSFLSGTFESCSFLSNSVDQFGGGVSASGVRTLAMTSVELVGNKAGQAGGGVFMEVTSKTQAHFAHSVHTVHKYCAYCTWAH